LNAIQRGKSFGHRSIQAGCGIRWPSRVHHQRSGSLATLSFPIACGGI
jgi:hypothetical protein